jgi:hypothetical protein
LFISEALLTYFVLVMGGTLLMETSDESVEQPPHTGTGGGFFGGARFRARRWVAWDTANATLSFSGCGPIILMSGRTAANAYCVSVRIVGTPTMRRYSAAQLVQILGFMIKAHDDAVDQEP